MKAIELTRGYIAKISDEDFEEISKYKWHIIFKRKNGKPYANTSIHISGSGKNRKKKNITMHRMVAKTDTHVDHINGDTLDNQRSNLRSCSNSQNHMNIPKMNKTTTSKYKGVSKRKNTNKWRVVIRVSGKHMELGSFDSEVIAAKVYNEAAIKHHGEFANLNILDED
jgi:hypothetical protein